MSNRIALDAGEAPVAVVDAPAAFSRGSVSAPISRWRLVASLQAAESLAVALSSCIWLRDLVTEGGSRASLFALISFGVALALVVHFVLRSFGAYDFRAILNAWRSSMTAATAWVLSTAPLLCWSIGLSPHGGLWRGSLQDWLLGGAFIVLIRLGAGYVGTALLLARRLSHNVAIVGNGPEARACAQALRADRSGTNVVGLIAADGNCIDWADDEACGHSVAKLQQLIRVHHIQDVIVATSAHERARLSDLIRGFSCLPVRVLLWPPSAGLAAGWVATTECKAGDMPLLVTNPPPLDGWRWLLKDVQDRTLAFLLLIFCAPVLLGLAALIPLCDRGPILFRQEREGYNGNKFVIFKFRTMRVSALKADRLVLTTKDDPRLFPLGALLRKTSLDELPQLLNVLRGDMWVIGPRPHSPLATAAGLSYSAAVKHYMARFKVKPGITGWAQVNGWRGATDTVEQIQQRVVHDLYYIDHWSVWLDFRILLQTLVRGFVHQNAY
jgi:Undecaprenyl-phosphate glucose phosphotransferase